MIVKFGFNKIIIVIITFASNCSTCAAWLKVMPREATLDRVLQIGQELPLAKVLPQAQLLECVTNLMRSDTHDGYKSAHAHVGPGEHAGADAGGGG